MKTFLAGLRAGINPAFALSYVLFWLGCIAFWICLVGPSRDGWVAFWYPVYNRLMLWSVAVQDRFCSAGPWSSK